MRILPAPAPPSSRSTMASQAALAAAFEMRVASAMVTSPFLAVGPQLRQVAACLAFRPRRPAVAVLAVFAVAPALHSQLPILAALGRLLRRLAPRDEQRAAERD